MAEFKEVLRQAKRMCDEFGDKCGICPIKDNCIMEATIESIDVEDFELKTMQ